MANNELNLGSTFKDFLNALNTNTEDTEGIIQGTKKVKKLSLGEEDELGDIEIIAKDNKKVVSIYGESICLDVSHDDETSSLQIGDRYSEIYSENGRIHLEAGDGISLHSTKNDTARIELDATNDSENGKLILKADEISIEGNVDFSNANVTGLPNSGGGSDCDTNAIIDVTALPTENINENVIYRLNIATYLFGASAGYQPFPMAKCNVVETLPSSGNPAATFDTSLNVTAIETYYEQSTNRNMGYVDETLSGIGNMPVGWYTAEQLFAVINRTYYGVIFSTSEMVDMGIYLLIEYSLYTYKNGIFKSLDIDVNKNYQWNGDNTFNGNNTFNGSVRLYGYTNFIGDPSEPSGSLAIYTNGFGIHSNETNFTKKVFFNGEVDFSNATVTGLPSGGGGGLDIPSNVISYNSENNALTFNAKVFINDNNYNYLRLYGDEYGDSFSIDLNDQAAMFNIYYNKQDDTSTIFFDGDIVDFSSAEVQVGNNLTIGSRGIASIEYDNEEQSLKVRNDEGSLYFNAEQAVAFNSNGAVAIECAGLSGINVDNTGVYIYDENVDTGNCANINLEDGIISLSSDNKIDFSGTVDFSNANVVGLPTNGGGGSLDLNADYNWNGNHTFNNGLTLNGALTLANNGEIDDSEDSLIIYKGTGSIWIGTENGGSIDINNDEMRVESYNHLTLSSNGITFGVVESIGIYAGENDDTYFEVSPTEFNVYANNGDINFHTGNQGSISFFATSEESESSIIVYDTVIEYNSQNHQFKGNVNFGLTNENARFEINVGADDDTTVYFTPTELLFSSVGVVNFTGNQGITFTAGANSSTKFNGAVDFSNANVTGLPSSGLTQEQVQEMINTAISGALEGNY